MREFQVSGFRFQVSGFERGTGSLGLFLEQILEGRTRIMGTQAGGSGGFFLVSHTDFEDGAFVAHIFLSNPQRNRLHAFEPAPRIEKRALFAGMQFEATLWTFALSRDALQHSPALRAARHCSGSWKIYRFGS
jgi:hypothetical protein